MVANRRVITGLLGILCATMATVGRAHPQHRRGEPNSFNVSGLLLLLPELVCSACRAHATRAAHTDGQDEQQVDVSKRPTPQQQFPDASMGGAGGDEAGMVAARGQGP